MRLELSCPVRCSDEPFGDLADVVIDPNRRSVTHLVVEPHRQHALARLVPLDLVAAEAGSHPAVELRCTIDDVRRLPPAQDFAYVLLGERLRADPEADSGIETVLAYPSYEPSGLGGLAGDLDAHYTMTYDRIPKGEIELRRKSPVFADDGHQLGHVCAFHVDADARITHVIFEVGHVLRRREVTIPAGATARLATDSITLDMTRRAVRAFPTAPARGWRA